MNKIKSLIRKISTAISVCLHEVIQRRSDGKQYAFYSQKMAQVAGEVMWVNKNGDKVICTGISNNRKCKGYGWDDKELLGEVDHLKKEYQ